MKKETWDLNEVSTRNCYNCMDDGKFVRCREEHEMTSNRGTQLTLKRILGLNGLCDDCVRCPDFDNNWLDV